MEKTSDVLFYDIMNYPVPTNWQYFSTEKTTTNEEKNTPSAFSWAKEHPLLEEYRCHILKHKKIFQSLPWIKTIYLCNSITFNSLHPKSDIDLFIIAKKWCLWRARLLSAIIFFVLGLKRSKNKTDKKYCLSFYITEEAVNLYSISLANTDIYLAYWLAHLVPLYQETQEKQTIYTHNQWIYSLLPNLPKDKHNINIHLPIFQENTKFKEVIEKYGNGFFGRIVEYLIKIIWIPLLIYKTKKLKEIGKDIIFNDTMLKFYHDKRKKISLLYRTRKTK